MARRVDAALDEAGLPYLQRSAWVEVDVDTLTANARALIELADPAALAPVVKADGYGHGLEMAARCAIAAGTKWLCVADASEATRLRSDGFQGRVLVLYPVPEAALPTLAHLGVDVTLGSRLGIEEASKAVADRNGPELRVHVEIDTGMTRGGASPEEAVALVRLVANSPGLEPTGTWTHFAAPEDPPMTRAQLDSFSTVLDMLDAAGMAPAEVHASASGGLMAGHVEGHTLVRPGLAFYGADPAAGTPLPAAVAPALALRAHPVRLVEVPAGTRVGYAGTWTAPSPSKIATLPLGYADGWSRSSSPGSEVLVEGLRAPVVGRISSDSLTVDVTGVPRVTLDSEFTLLGRDGDDEIDADEVAKARGTISWEVLQQLGSRLSRVYTSGDGAVGIRAESTTTVTMTSTSPRF